MNVLGRLFLNSCKDRHKDAMTDFFLWDVEELTLLIKAKLLLIIYKPASNTFLFMIRSGWKEEKKER